MYSVFSLLPWPFITLYRLLHCKLKTPNYFLHKPLYIVPIITLSKNAKPRYYDVKILLPHNFCLIFINDTCYETLNKLWNTPIVLITVVLEVIKVISAAWPITSVHKEHWCLYVYIEALNEVCFYINCILLNSIIFLMKPI